MHYFLLIYLSSKPLHVSGKLAAPHQEDQLCINSNCMNFIEAIPLCVNTISIYIFTSYTTINIIIHTVICKSWPDDGRKGDRNM